MGDSDAIAPPPSCPTQAPPQTAPATGNCPGDCTGPSTDCTVDCTNCSADPLQRWRLLLEERRRPTLRPHAVWEPHAHEHPAGYDSAEDALFRVMARVERIGGHYADMYFQALSVTGLCLGATAQGMGGLRLSFQRRQRHGQRQRRLHEPLADIRTCCFKGGARLLARQDCLITSTCTSRTSRTSAALWVVFSARTTTRRRNSGAHCKSLVQPVQLQAISKDAVEANKFSSIAQVPPE